MKDLRKHSAQGEPSSTTLGKDGILSLTVKAVLILEERQPEIDKLTKAQGEPICTALGKGGILPP